MCVSCRQHYKPKELIRIAKIKDEFVLDREHKLGGRGAYVCLNCKYKIYKKKLLNKSFKTSVPDEIYKEVENYEQNS